MRGTHKVPGQPSPAGHHIHNQIMETKKTWEYVSIRAYPIAQALALPLLKDKQRKACPRQR